MGVVNPGFEQVVPDKDVFRSGLVEGYGTAIKGVEDREEIHVIAAITKKEADDPDGWSGSRIQPLDRGIFRTIGRNIGLPADIASQVWQRIYLDKLAAEILSVVPKHGCGNTEGHCRDYHFLQP